MIAFPLYVVAACAEIAGCFAFWAYWRLDKSPWWLVPGLTSLLLFVWLLTRIDTNFAGRAFAAYGGIYILTSIGWMWLVEHHRPDRWDLAGAAICLVGSCVILFGPRSA